MNLSIVISGNMLRTVILAVALCLFGCNPSQPSEKVILITLDGMRWQEVFGGAELQRISGKSATDSSAVIKDFWADDTLARRKRLMPFLWDVVGTKGQVLGNRRYNNFMNVTNKFWFSYPGYNELLCGLADDKRITSNDKVNNPNKTFLEYLNRRPEYGGKVAVFSSWDVMEYIVNAERSDVPVNAGQKIATQPNEKEKVINELMFQVPNPLGDGVRLDAFTFHYAFEYLKRERPEMLYISFDETDDFAHGGRYDLYLHSAQNADKMIQTLYNWCQADPDYKDHTTFIITCDHGRGRGDQWTDHSDTIVGADQIWMAVIGPQTSPEGEIRLKDQNYQKQIASTIATFLHVQLDSIPEKNPIQSVIKTQ